MNTQTKKHYDKVARLGCILCRQFGFKDTPAEIHHIRRFGGLRENAEVIPLCPEHHRGNTGVHGLGAKGFERRYNLTQEDLLTYTTRLLAIDE
jgi:hypothetical protein